MSTVGIFLAQRPFALVRLRHQGIQLYQQRQYNRSHNLSHILQLWQKNGTRHYARYIVTMLMAAAAAAKQKKAQCEVAASRPSNWAEWERKDWTDALLDQLGKNRFTRFWNAACRVVSLGILATPLAVMLPVSVAIPYFKDWTWSYALWSIEQAGPTFLKLAQWATTRHDLFSPEFCQYFGKLRDDTVGHSWKETQKLLQDELGDRKNYFQLDPAPIGSGCIAQVYRGKLQKDSGGYPAGTEVAVKVQHPGILYKVCVDFYIMAKVARFLESLPFNLEYLSLVDSVVQFRDIMLPQLDLTMEADNLERFNKDFADDERVSFPEPMRELTSQKVLTETFIRGVPIMEYRASSADVKKDIAMLGLVTTLRMIFLNDFLHGDLHPGNILVSHDDKGKAHLHLLDCGITVEMGPDQHVNVVKILGAFVRQDGRKAGQLMVDTSATRKQASELDVALFVEGIAGIVSSDKKNNFVENVGDYIVDICYLACNHKVKLESSFVSAALAVEIMEGIASALYPEIKVIPVAMPLVIKAEMMHRLPKFHLW